MTEPTVTVSRGTRTLDPGEASFWGAAPLVSIADGVSAGHIRAEVWSDGFVSLCMSSPALIPAGLAVLSGATPVDIPQGRLPSVPVMTQHDEATFLGWIAIEFVDGHAPVVGARGSDANALVKFTAARLAHIS